MERRAADSGPMNFTYAMRTAMHPLRRILTVASILASAATVSAQMVPPSNDECVNAIVIGDGTVNGTTLGSTISTNGCGLSGLTIDVWYSYTALRSGLLALSTCGSGFDSSITLYASCTQLVNQLACNDDAPQGSPCGYATHDAFLTYPIATGQTYKIRISGFSGQQGTFRLTTLNDTGQPFCLGDGVSATVCPCGNSVAAGTLSGCKNSVGVGAKIDASGFPDVSSDSVQLLVSGLPANAPVLFFQGTLKQASGYGASFGDGVRCVSGNYVRLSTKPAVLGTATYPVAGELPLSSMGLVPASGGARFYQGWYRNSDPFCTLATFNLTNGLELVWQP